MAESEMAMIKQEIREGEQPGGERCRVFAERLFSGELGNYDTYGLSFEAGGYRDCVHDVLVNREKASRMAEMFNRYELSPLHFRDAVEDMICE